jgi:hypothetical protein
LAKIDVSKHAPPERINVVSEAIYGAMVQIANVPLQDKFQVVASSLSLNSVSALGARGYRRV